jgi:hypothetical protein
MRDLRTERMDRAFIGQRTRSTVTSVGGRLDDLFYGKRTKRRSQRMSKFVTIQWAT